jgi:hypothetical protein
MKQLTDISYLRNEIFQVTENNFNALALNIFRFQYDQNTVYRQYCNALQIKTGSVQSLQQIPFLPIQFFKSAKITSTVFEPAVIFESSGTTGSVNSKHFIKDTGIYEASFLKAFHLFYGDITGYCIIGLLPSYLERKNSSLVWMVNDLIKRSLHPQSGFYLYDHEKLNQVLLQNEQAGQHTLLIGVTFALLDFFEKYPLKLSYTTVMETGGMKGRREEFTRATVHRLLKDQTGIETIHSEYGMTELLSQAYSKKDGIFQCPPWMKILVRSEDDPFEIILPENSTRPFLNGVVNVIDFANLFSCSFIATDDMGKLYNDGSFEILGRMDYSDVRGCSLMLV